MWKHLSRLVTFLAILSHLFVNVKPVQAAATPDPFNTLSPIDGAINVHYDAMLDWETTQAGQGDIDHYNVCVGRQEGWDYCDYYEEFTVTYTYLDQIDHVPGQAYLTNGQTYYWMVKAVNHWGLTYEREANGGVWHTFTLMPSPGAFSKTAPANNAVDQNKNITLSWSASSNVTRYDYCYNTSASCASWTSAGTNTSVTLSNLTPGTKYYWHVRAYNYNATTYSDSNTWWAFTVQNAPAAFNKTAPTNGATGQALNPTLSWGSSTYASSYQFCVGTSSGSCNTIAWTGTGTNTSTVPVGLSSGTTYYWQVKAINQNGETQANGGTWWSFATAGMPQAFNKSSPSNTATGQSANPTISWAASTNATSYAYCFDTNNDNTCNGSWISTGTSTSASLSGLTPGTTYFWQVKAVSPVGETLANGGAWWSFTVMPLPGSLNKTGPANAATGVITRPTLSWTVSSNVSSYYYCIDTSNDNACSTGWVSTTNTSAALTGLLPTTTYYWQVKAINLNGETQADGGTWFSFTTAAAPGAFVKLSPSNNVVDQYLSFSISWSISTNSTSYAYCVDTVNDNTCNGTWINVGTNTSTTLSGLSTGTTYYWQVKAINIEDETEADSDTWFSFRTYYVPGSFSKVAPTNGATGQLTNLTLTWGASSHATLYDYCIDTNNNNLCDTGWISTGVTNAPLSSLTAGISYYWQVRAYNAFASTTANAGTWWSFTTLPIPGAFDQVSPASGTIGLATSVTLIWTSSSSASSYQVCYDTTDNNACDGTWLTRTATSTTITGLTPGATYYWHVRALNGNGSAEGSGGAWWSFSVLPQPGTFTKTIPIDSAVDQPINNLLFTWEPSSNAASYQLCYDTSTNSICNSSWIATSATSVILNSLTPNTTYNWQVQAVNITGTTGADGGTWFTFRTLPLPTAFGKTSPASGTTGLLPDGTVLTWASSTILTGYQVCYDTTNNNTCNGTWISVASTANSLTINGLNSNTTYYWQVRATNTNGLTDADGGAWWSFSTTLGAVTPTSPVNTTAPPRPLFTWPPLTGASYYYLQINGPGGVIFNQWYEASIYCTSGTCAVTPAVTLAPGTYTWVVLSWGNNVTGPWSAPAAFNVVDRPGAPILIVPTGIITPIGPTFNWYSSSGVVTDYYLWLNSSTGNIHNKWYTTSEANCNTGGFCTVTLTNTLDLGNYTWYVQARNTSGTGPWSAGMNFKVAPPAPDAAILTWPVSSATVEVQPSFQFSHVPRAAWYLVEVRRGSVLGEIVYQKWYQETVPPSGSYYIAPAESPFPAGSYSWRVHAWNETGYGPWSTSEVFSVINLPGPATQVAPSGTISAQPLTFTWNIPAVNAQFGAAADYHIFVNSATGAVIDTWYTAAEANCGVSVCNATASITLGPGDYSWWVQTRNSSGLGAWSTGLKFTILPTAPGSVGTLLNPPNAANAAAQPTFIWSIAANATWYLLEVHQGSSTGPVVISQWNNASICNTTNCSLLSPVTFTPGIYYWNVRTWGPGGYGLWYPTWYQLTVPFPPTAPIPVSPNGIVGTLYPAYTWQRVSGAEGYRLWVQSPSGPLVDVGVSDSTACSGTTCTFMPAVTHAFNGTYTWWVQARNSVGGLSPWSTGMSFTVSLPIPTAAVLVAPLGGATVSHFPTFSWNDVANAAWYRIQVLSGATVVYNVWVSDLQTCGTSIPHTAATTCSFTAAASLPSGAYTWTVLSYNPTGTTLSATGSFTVAP